MQKNLTGHRVIRHDRHKTKKYQQSHANSGDNTQTKPARDGEFGFSSGGIFHVN